jgi:hypothetical protein
MEQSNTAVRYSGTWYNNNNSSHSGGSAKLTNAAGARATFTFSGTSVSWIAYRDQWSGIAEVYVDGALKGQIDTYSATAQAKAVMYKLSGMPNSTHTIAIQATGRKNASSGGPWVWVDAFDYAGTTVTSSQVVSSASLAGGSSLMSDGVQNLQIGYAEIQSTGNAVPNAVAILGYKQNDVLVTETGVPASAPMTKGRIYAEVAGNVNTGFAVANPNDSEATVNFFFTDPNGANSGAGVLKVPARAQIARFLDEEPFNLVRPKHGTFTFSSNVPVSAVGIRGLLNERTEFVFTTLPMANLDELTPASMFFPHFADGAGWKTDFVLVNPTDQTITGSLQVDGEQRTSYKYSIPPRSARNFPTAGTGTQLRSGSAQVTPDLSSITPVGVAIFSYRNAGVTVSEAGVPAINAGAAFRMYAEGGNTSPIQTGLAVMNLGSSETRVRFDLAYLDGRPAGLTGSLVLPANGQKALFLSGIPGFESLPAGFKGVARVYSENQTDIAVMGLRCRWNERFDFLTTTTTPVNESEPASSRLVIPHIADGAGFTTQFIMFSGSSNQPGTGNLITYGQSGANLSLGLH